MNRLVTVRLKPLVALAALLLMTMLVSVVYGQATPTPVTARSAAPDGSKYQLVEIASGISNTILAVGAGDGSGRLFIVSQDGKIFIYQNGAVLPTPFLDVSALVTRDASERGLLGLAFHPKYAQNGLFFIDYTDVNGDTAVARYKVSASDPNVADPSSAQIILSVPQPYANHNGGNVIFGPDDYLYIGLGDGGSEGDPLGNGQNPQTMLSKILRIDVDNGTPYGIPADNPYVNNPSLVKEAWAWGLRNPWRFNFDRATGDLYIGDVGQNQWEEIDFQPADSKGGENYGWNIMEATHKYSGAPAPADLVAPIFEYPHSQGCAVTGGYVYRGSALPDLQGVYFFSDYCFGTIWASYRDDSGKWNTNVFLDTHLTVTSFGQDDDGELYVTTGGGGTVLKLVAKS